jgi:hypothetical protein
MVEKYQYETHNNLKALPSSEGVGYGPLFDGTHEMGSEQES